MGPCHLQIKKIIDDAINIPDEDNDWMREQLRELAVINGTLRDSDTIKSASFIPVLVHRFFGFIIKFTFIPRCVVVASICCCTQSCRFAWKTWISWEFEVDLGKVGRKQEVGENLYFFWYYK